MPEVKVSRPPEVTETATKPSPASFQKHSPGGCTHHRYVPAEMPTAGHIVFRRDILFATLPFKNNKRKRLSVAMPFITAAHCHNINRPIG